MAENGIRGKPGDFVVLDQVPWTQILRPRFGRSQERHLEGNEVSGTGQREKFECDAVAAEALACPVQLRALELSQSFRVVPNGCFVPSHQPVLGYGLSPGRSKAVCPSESNSQRWTEP